MNEQTGPPSSAAAVPSVEAAVAVVADQRLVRGARARHKIARRAVDIASLEGLNGLSIGRLATDLGISKSGIQTLFKTKENLQLAAAETARREFAEAVIRPAQTAPAGAARLKSLTENWIAYAEAPLFAGGCFWAATLPDFDSRPGKVRDTLLLHRNAWLGLLADELRQAVDNGEIAELDTELTAFHIDAVLTAANTALRLGDSTVPSKVRRIVKEFLTPPH
ncbi:TetR/AcrR family transcriptional regulator [Streptomyces sp. PKU-EA00015]|uniref:TetR/AcrR family transcriptional regulator n=1 Tax=Streptomyces sp. PKU-EA00015 TaxID=2748326 RepID=UPI0015A1E75D|nr:TetR/AcrR family transcriptional regulator [Streptomyces sp. PKU-EA00015]NWF27390.1 TetR/AcrR family transcriptional regulator [Streptomyces sp. PKU-EA00015]